MSQDADPGEETLVRSTLDQLLRAHDPGHTDRGDFLAAQFDAGLAWVHFPRGLGGLGVSQDLQTLVENRLRAAGFAARAREDMLGYRMGGPTIERHGTPEQKQRYIRPAFTNEARWCQLFSEPGAGSDLASLSTRALPHQGGWLITGQKVWSSYARSADLGMLLARTDPDLPKHQGITFFVIDMHAPGVEVRPLRQITGEADFNETFLTDVYVPDECRIGPVGAGWKIAQTTLSNERGTYGTRGFETASEGTAVRMALDLIGTSESVSPELRTRIVDLWVRSLLLGWTNQRILRNDPADVVPAPVGKLGFADVQQAGYELCIDIMAEGVLTGAAGGDDGRLFDVRDPRHMYLRSRANSIEGGTSEVMKNILATRVLGLPAEARGDQTTPWSQLPRN